MKRAWQIVTLDRQIQQSETAPPPLPPLLLLFAAGAEAEDWIACFDAALGRTAREDWRTGGLSGGGFDWDWSAGRGVVRPWPGPGRDDDDPSPFWRGRGGVPAPGLARFLSCWKACRL